MKLIPAILSSTLLLLVGCSSPASEVRYYQLVAQTPPAIDTRVQQPLVLAPIKVASYLNGSGLVLQQSAVEFSIARQHLWADALEQQLQRQLTEYLLLALPKQPLAAFNAIGARTLQLEIDRFYASESGQAIVSGRYNISGAVLDSTVPFSYQVALANDGYPAMVQALSLGWQQLLQELVAALAVTHSSVE
ncbi:hypothetical protein GCM10010919_11920 [Alishewanella longhuensis]|uniref:ABC-type transport auxiliary lipoprotein component domain-containing protein n=1 Tax=Alishewanella longhuensis TaxID=1091037 RepID=A0ABQ3KW09_9ALTE|nr:ABC-type transport auxiliary lipoprotein family protein [Alishewanella longhuensis]GHG64931.1 hypothetical protein GCM10010919_11920 [Alishewanella longhuensis]